MRTKRTLSTGVALALLLLVGWPMAAHAFFPIGGFSQYGSVKYATWSWGSLNDVNNDRDISGPNEGIEIMFEGGALGWTDSEINILKQAFQVWQDVPTSYVGFQYTGVNEDPLFLGMEGDSLAGDLINYVAIEWPGDPILAGVGNGILGLTILTYVVDDTWIEHAGTGVQFYLTGAQMIEADIIIDGPSHRSTVAGQEPEADLLGTMVHEIGHFVGLGHTPLNNLELTSEGLFESPAIMLSDASGIAKMTGATPTMFPIYFEIDDGQGGYDPGDADLAPDDIAGLSFLYPRGSQNNFFTITQSARSQTRDSFPSIPLGGGHVVAWCDADNNPYTRRIALFSTMAGLYEYYPANIGRFFLYGMYKKIESVDGPFQATYTLTHNALNESSFEGQAPFGYFTEDFDSLEGGSDAYMAPAWPSEVFHETGNLINIDKYEVGTILAFDTQRSAVVSTLTGKTLATMLPSPYPMFGDPNNVCPLNITMAGIASQSTSEKLRALRDHVLLKSHLGTLLVDAYYRVSPAMAGYLLKHALVYQAARTAMRGVEWLVTHAELLLAIWVGVIAVVLLRRRRIAAAAVVLMASFLLIASPAEALIKCLTDEEMMSMADDVVTGTVTAVETVEQQLPGLKYMVTNVTVEPSDTVKAVINKSSSVPLRIPGGRKGSIIARVPDFPQFKVGQEVVLFLKYQPRTATYSVVGGNRGTFAIYTDSTGKKYVLSSSAEAAAALKTAQKSMESADGSASKDADQDAPPKVSLEAYKKYLRDIVNDQKKD